MTDSPDELDEVVHQRTRLGILAVLAEADKAQFSFLKETLGLSDGNLSRHLMILEEAKLVRIDKGYEGKRPRTWASITPAGKRAFRAEIASLKRLVARFESVDNGGSQPAAATEVVIRAARADGSPRSAPRVTGREPLAGRAGPRNAHSGG